MGVADDEFVIFVALQFLPSRRELSLFMKHGVFEDLLISFLRAGGWSCCSYIYTARRDL